MAHKSLLPKQRALTEHETQTSIDSWRECMLFHISLDSKSARFLPSGDLHAWTLAEDRGFTDDPEGYAADAKMNKAAKAALLTIILGSVSSFAKALNK